MRAPLLLPISLALLASFPALAQDAPKVIFCSGPCFAVDANGIRTPAPKGTELRPDQRLETGPGAYAQVKLGPDAAMALGDGARVRFDQKNFRDRLIVFLDAGRVRMIGGEAIGKPITRPVELHTADGAFVLRNADIEVKKAGTPNTASALTMMKVNAGDARLRSGQTDVAVSKERVHGFAAGRPVTRSIPITEMALRTRTSASTTNIQPVTPAPQLSVAIATPLRASQLPPVVRIPETIYQPDGLRPLQLPPLTKVDQDLRTAVLTKDGTVTTLYSALQTYALTTTPTVSGSTTDTRIQLLDSATVIQGVQVPLTISETTTVKTLTDITVTNSLITPTGVTETKTITDLNTALITTPPPTIKPISPIISPILIRR